MLTKILKLFVIIGLSSVLFSPSQSVTWAQESVPDQPKSAQAKLKTGWIDAVTKTDIVIDDLASPLSGVTVVDQNGFTVDVSSLVVGRYVAFNRDGEKTVIQLLAEKGKRPESPAEIITKDKLESKKESIRQVDGVWKN